MMLNSLGGTLFRWARSRPRDVQPRTLLASFAHGERDEQVTGTLPAISPAARRSATLEAVERVSSRAELLEQRLRWRREGKTVVFTNGCYDLLHPGHIRMLERARSLGDVLILALNSDDSVRRMKGPSRPLLAEQERAEVALALEAVDAVTFFDEDTPRELIAVILPDVLVKGADWSHFVAGREEVEAAGGKVLNLPLEPGHSTTNLVELILNQQP
jgi:D-glycero-beta-D-manno-heptose 1-phosphate adenylyltransferase